MNKIFFTLFCSLLLAPSFAFALDYSSCDTGTAECYCTPNDPIGIEQSIITSIQKCQYACYSIEPYAGALGGEITGYSVQCQVGGATATISQGDLDSLSLDYADCDAGTPRCYCAPDDVIPVDQSKVTSVQMCQDVCDSFEPYASSLGGEITGYSVQCEIRGASVVLSQGTLDGPLGDASFGPIAPNTTISTSEPDETYPVPMLGVDIPGLEFTPATKTDDSITSNYLGEYIQAALNFVFPAASLLAIVMMMIGGIEYILARGDKGKITTATTHLKQAVTGIILLFGAFTIASVVDPGFLIYEGLSPHYITAEFVSTEDTFSDIAGLNLSNPPNTISDIPSDGTNGVTYYTQRGNDTPYGSCGTVATSGCGVTSTAMVLTYLGYTITPSELATLWGSQGSCPQSADYGTSCRACPLSGDCSCMGTRWDSFTTSNVIQDNGFTGTMISTREQIITYLENNQPIIASMGPGIFTSSGHFIVLTGVDGNGNVLVNDPNSGIQSASYDDVFGALKGAWYIKKD